MPFGGDEPLGRSTGVSTFPDRNRTRAGNLNVGSDIFELGLGLELLESHTPRSPPVSSRPLFP